MKSERYSQSTSEYVDAIPDRQIRAHYNAETIRVYQAYSDAIADSALSNGTFMEPEFKMTRMTWIKPSFLWMMYRSGWGGKEGQRRILAIDISLKGFEWALANSCLSHPAGLSTADARKLMDRRPVRVQWDPERDLHHAPLAHRSIQIGLSGEAVNRYVNEWIQDISEITATARQMDELVRAGRTADAAAKLPVERAYVPSVAASRAIELPA